MTLQTQLMSDMKEAMKAHDATRLGVVRFLMSEIKNAQIDGAGSDDASLQKVVASQVKKSKEAVAEFVAAGRQDLADEEQAKIGIMEKYLPAQLDEAALEKIVRETLAEIGAVKNPGQIIGAVVKKVAGQADGGRIKAMVEKVTAS
ncbi:GatB/YqeY domain-containing protein [bacterium]|nr:GatB/YqeY domain-containing protein [bacterium]